MGRLRSLTVAVACGMVLAGCGGSGSTTAGPAPAETTLPEVTVTEVPSTTGPAAAAVPPQLTGLTFTAITIGERELSFVAVADGAGERMRGLMFVEDLLDVDGMLFVYGAEQFGSFWMKDTLIPLDIAFFDGDGMLVTKLRMEPCPDLGDRCPSYVPDGEFRYALETEAGDLEWLDSGDVLTIP